MRQTVLDDVLIYIDEKRFSDACNGEETLDFYVERLTVALRDGGFRVACLYAMDLPVSQSATEVFSLDADEIIGIAFLKELMAQVGGYHPLCAEEGMYELLCRLMMGAGNTEKCAMVAVSNAVNVVPALTKQEGDDQFASAHRQELSFVYAYVMRFHMQELHQRALTEPVFTGICALMQEKGCMDLFQQDMNYLLSNEQEFERIAVYTAPFLVLRGDDTCGGVLQRFADDLTQALIECGQAVLEPLGEEFAYETLQGRIFKGVIGFQSPALEISFFRNLIGPKFQFWFDNPLTFEKVLRDLPEDHYILCQDADHAEWIRSFYHTEHAIQFPPGGIDMVGKGSKRWDEEEWSGGEERIYDIVFMGRYFEDVPERLNEKQRRFYDHLLEHPRLNFVNALALLDEWGGMAGERSSAADGQGDGGDIPARILELKPACRAVIGHFRNKVIETILQAGFKVQVYGEDWKKYAGAGRENLVVHPEVSVEDSLEEFRRAKIGLNIMSWYKAGMTERVANIMLSGAVCVSDETAYLREHTRPGEELELYCLDKLEELPVILRRLLDDETYRQQIAYLGYRKAAEEFSWRSRAEQLIELAESRLDTNADK